ncbi:uncharacterized protein STEHIDRAFT_162980 [Stereum hirsutum FP-91666 SS1]|uniref:DUF6534 domain-containing protein n=1 Tax=Stereum hirsutum (strain FP-91666) TaxID=721885 RepID=R7RXN2_STEHR|nr:uncharacterized protein STEHIDRAFT_162980 [Stereum hirsutum FP-91666 SS1]EIM80094.1 hypothetical protein STEHIDRAFT_162980 [Stereum hirsutum FP-91666 SS1]
MGSPAAIVQGPSLIGIFLNLILYGAMCVQVFYYYTRYPKDTVWIKLYVALLFVADTLNSAFNMIYDVLVTDWGNAEALAVGNWIFCTDPAMTGIIAGLVQSFFCWRIWVLTRSKIIVAIIGFATVCCTLGGIGSGIAVGIMKQWAILQNGTGILVVWLAGGAIADIGITVVITWHIRRHAVNFKQRQDPLSRLVRLTISNGLMTTLVNVADIIAFVASTGGMHLLFNFPLAKLYTNSAMATLNQRERNRTEQSSTSRTPSAKVFTDGHGNRPVRADGAVTVTVERHEMVDMPKGDEEWELGRDTKQDSF